ncbi:MAG: rhomboid family intramembrane serine protease [Nostocoides sp.]
MDCVRDAAKATRTGTTIFGGKVTDGRPLVTWAIVAICVVVWLGEKSSTTVYQEVAFSSALGESEPWRFLTSAFAHDRNNIFHILFNMYALWIIGPYLEALLGHVRFAAAYLICAFGGSVTWLLLSSPPGPGENPYASDWYVGLVGASGAVFGLFAMLIVLNRRLGRSSTFIWATVAINAVLGFTIPGIAWEAHLGGFVTGAVCAGIIGYAVRGRSQAIQQWVGLGLVTLVLVVLAVGKYLVVA